jgi:hypothetical protein
MRNGGSWAGDDRKDMTHHSRFRRVPRTTVTDDRILDGREGHEIPQLVAVLAALRDLADEPVAPNAALRDVLEGGIRPEQVRAPATPAASSARRPLLRVMTAKLAGLGLLAQIGIGVATASTLTVGAATTDSLPGPAQDAVAGFVARISPFELPGRGDVGEQVPGDARDQTTGVSGTDVADQVVPVSPPSVDDLPVGPPPFDGESEPPGFDVVEDTPAAERVTPPYEYWRPRGTASPEDPGDEQDAGRASQPPASPPASPPTPGPSQRPSDQPSDR